jgi:predicted Rossmann fold nucleotide-binding protein DprA/Smf involved in DNA uptake
VYRTHELGAEPLDPPERFLRRMPPSFSTAEAEEKAEEMDVPRRTLFKWLGDLQDEGKLKRIHRGRYEKTA